MKLAIVGATGLVGGVMVRVLEERGFPVSELIPVASERSSGKEILFKGQPFRVVMPSAAVDRRPELALFSAGAAVSLQWAPVFADAGTTVIDNSSAWRKMPEVPLVIPEVNAQVLKEGDRIIANPNCSTIQLVVVLHALHRHYGLKRVVVSTYQSVTGSGNRGLRQLQAERNHETAERFYPHPIDLNIIPHGGSFTDGGYTTEEVKLTEESRKILGLPELRITGTVVRVPVYGGHSESVNVELEQPAGAEEVRALLARTPGLTVLDNPAADEYPMPRYAEGKDEIFVGRIRKDETVPSGLNLWIVSDNLRKGAATNAVQIAEYLLARHLL